MSRPKWYIVQVSTGQEAIACHRIVSVCQAQNGVGGPLVHECFAPRFLTRHKFGGEWRDVEKRLLPGYVVVVTDKPGALARVLKTMPGFARVLTQGETFVPLSKGDREWMETFTSKGERTIALSVAYKEGDRVIVTSGPLKGREGLIKGVNRSKCLAILEFSVGGIRITARVGLAIVNKTY